MDVSAQRAAQVADLIERVTRWAGTRTDVVGVLLVGSYARGAARPDSDMDLMLLTKRPDRYINSAGWAGALPLGEVIRTRRWGVITERRFGTASGLEVELGIGTPGWANVSPIDPGTQRVVAHGARILHDPAGLLRRLLEQAGTGQLD